MFAPERPVKAAGRLFGLERAKRWQVGESGCGKHDDRNRLPVVSCITAGQDLPAGAEVGCHKKSRSSSEFPYASIRVVKQILEITLLIQFKQRSASGSHSVDDGEPASKTEHSHR